MDYFSSEHELLHCALHDFDIPNPQLVEVTDANWQDLYDSGAFSYEE